MIKGVFDLFNIIAANLTGLYKVLFMINEILDSQMVTHVNSL